MTPEKSKNSSLKLSDIELLCADNVKIKNVAAVEHKINQLIDGGCNKLQIVSDFDFTITKQHLENNEKVLTSFGIFNECKNLPPHYLEESFRLFKIYRPIEIDPHIPINEKIKYMIEWWTLTGELLKGFEFELSQIEEVVAKRFHNALRDGSNELFSELNETNVPVLVFSAGLGDSVISVLKHAQVMYPNVKVISNFLQFRDGQILNGLQDKMIHTFNKNEHALEGTDYYQLVHDRDHVIVMGDSLGDADMADGVPMQSHVLKIGFLYDHAEHNLPAYLNRFDIVLIDDQTMDVPRALLKLIKHQGAAS